MEWLACKEIFFYNSSTYIYTVLARINPAAPRNGVIKPSRRQSPQAIVRVLHSRSSKNQLIEVPAGKRAIPQNKPSKAFSLISAVARLLEYVLILLCCAKALRGRIDIRAKPFPESPGTNFPLRVPRSRSDPINIFPAEALSRTLKRQFYYSRTLEKQLFSAGFTALVRYIYILAMQSFSLSVAIPRWLCCKRT